MRLFVGLLCAQVRGWLVGMVFDCSSRPIVALFRWNTLLKDLHGRPIDPEEYIFNPLCQKRLQNSAQEEVFTIKEFYF